MKGKKDLLTFISDQDLYKHVRNVLGVIKSAKAGNDLYSNVVDPFSAVFDSLHQGVSLAQWLEQEKSRQIQKTMQNALGEFHENILGSIPGWEKLPVGNVVDVRNMENKIIAEVKNKYNTTKGTDKKSIYDNLKSQLKKKKYSGFTGYYVEVIPKRKEPYDKPFTPSDNITKTRRPKNDKIKVIDGRSFYALASGKKGTLKELYEVLPNVINDILKRSSKTNYKEKVFYDLFNRAY